MDEKVISQQSVKKVLSDYLSQYRAHPWLTSLSFIIPAVGDIFIFLVPPFILGKIIDRFIDIGAINLAAVVDLIIIAAIFWFFGEILWRTGLFTLTYLEAESIARLAKLAFDRLVDRDYSFYTDNFVGSLTKKAIAFSRSFEVVTDTVVFNIANSVLPLIFVTVMLSRYSFWLPTILLIFIGITVILAVPIMRKRSRLVALRHEASSRISGRLSDVLTNALAMKSFSAEKCERVSYDDYIGIWKERFIRAANYANLRLDFVIFPLYVAANIAGLLAAIYITSEKTLPPGSVIVVFTYYAYVTRSMWQINRTYRNLESAVTEAAEFNELFLDPPEIQDSKNSHALKITDCNISFKDVHFSYLAKDRANTVFLKDFNLEIRSREKVGLVGPSGGGKTTITKLLLRYLDVEQGSISIDGQDIRKVTQNSLRSLISYVPQDPLLFHRSLSENISYGSARATVNEIITASKLAHAHEFINELPNGYDTLVGERGIKLSGGQRQRIAIARAIVKNAPILVLDEATSSLDSESEKYIQAGLKELMNNKTALVIAHRLSTIKHLDRIIVLDTGRIVEEGTHASLIAKKGLYAKLWSHQSGEFL